MDNKDFIEKYQQDILEIIAFFSNKNKYERELWVVREFLANLHIEFNENELIPITNDPPDVVYKDAKFETKEIMDENRQRDKEYKEELLKCNSFKRPSDLFILYTPKDLTLQNIVDITADHLKKYENKYDSKTKKNLDMLFYFNLLDYHLNEDKTQYSIPNYVSNFGWRSISVGKNNLSCVIYTSESAPDFLKPFEGKIIFR